MRSVRQPLRLVFAGLLTAFGASTHAQDSATDVPGDARIRSAVDALPGASANAAPRVTRSDGLMDGQRSQPGYRNEATEMSYRWWLSAGRADVGLGLGALSYGLRPTGSIPGLAGDGATIVSGTGTVLTLGMRYRTSPHSAFFADASGVRGLGISDAVVGKVGVEFKSARSSWNIAYGGLGLHLGEDTRMTVRLRKGGLGVAMQRSF